MEGNTQKKSIRPLSQNLNSEMNVAANSNYPMNRNGNPAQTTGVKAEERSLIGEGQSYFGNIGNYIQSISSYLPSSVKKIGGTTNSFNANSSNFSTERDNVLFTCFDYLPIAPNQKSELCLFIGYTNGYQVWNIETTDNVYEILSKREGPIKYIKLLPNPPTGETSDSTEEYPLETPEQPFYGKRPILALLSGADVNNTHYSNFPNKFVKLYSLKTHEYINVLRFKSEIFSVQCSTRLFVVGTRDQIFIFDAISMQKKVVLPMFPVQATPSIYGVSNSISKAIAVGKRWVAFPGCQPLPHPPTNIPSRDSVNGTSNSSNVGRNTGSNANMNVDRIVEVAKDVAKDFATGIYQMGQKTISDYMFSNSSSSSSNNTSNINNGLSTDPVNSNGSSSIGTSGVSTSTGSTSTGVDGIHASEMEYAGTVLIYDAEKNKIIAHFQAHSHPISVMTFDASGSLLVTTSVEGHNFNVYHISPNPLYIHSTDNFSVYAPLYNYRHLYKLQRGYTNASILNIGFSDDSRWIAVSSTRTVHIYAINPTGGPVSVYTHLRANSNSNAIYNNKLLPDYVAPPPLSSTRGEYSSINGGMNTNPSASVIALSAFNRIKLPSISDDSTSISVSGITNALFNSTLANSSGTTTGSTTVVNNSNNGELNSKSAVYFTASSTFVGNPFAMEKLYTVSNALSLTLFRLKPHGPPSDSDADPNMLQLTVEPLVEWDVCRKTKWNEVLLQNTSEKTYDTISNKQVENKTMNWLANVEINTHSPLLRPLWASPQFAFKTFQNPNINSGAEQSINKTVTTNEHTTMTVKGEYLYDDDQLGDKSGYNRLVDQRNVVDNKQLFSHSSSPPISLTASVPALTRKIEVSHHQPMPFREGVDSSQMPSHSPSSYSTYPGAPSAPSSSFTDASVSEQSLKVNLLDAMNTPLYPQLDPVDTLPKSPVESYSPHITSYAVPQIVYSPLNQLESAPTISSIQKTSNLIDITSNDFFSADKVSKQTNTILDQIQSEQTKPINSSDFNSISNSSKSKKSKESTTLSFDGDESSPLTLVSETPKFQNNQSWTSDNVTNSSNNSISSSPSSTSTRRNSKSKRKNKSSTSEQKDD